MCSLQASSKPVRGIRLTTLKSKLSSKLTNRNASILPCSYILWKVVYRNTRYMCITLVANIIWRSGHAIPSSFLLDFSFPHHRLRRFFTVFYNSAMWHDRSGRALNSLSVCDWPKFRNQRLAEISDWPNFRNQLLERHLAADYIVIKSRTLKVTVIMSCMTAVYDLYG